MEKSSSSLSTTFDTSDLADKPSSISQVLKSRDLVSNILSRVPAESLLISKRVCKYWKFLIKDTDFVRQHHIHHKTKNHSIGFAMITAAETGSKYDVTILNRLGDESENVPAGKEKQKIVDSETGNSEKQKFKDFVLTVPSRRFALMMTSCNGLLCFHTQHPFLIWNPFTKEYVPFEKRKLKDHQATMCGFGFDAATGKYKLVHVYERKSDFGLVCDVLELGTATDWRRIEHQAKFPHPELKDPEFGPASVFVEGSVNWRVKSGVLCFSTTAEKFNLIPSLDQETQCRGLRGISVDFLGELAGSLCWNEHFIDAEMLGIWYMQKDLLDKNKNPWVSQYRIEVNSLGRYPEVHMKAFCFTNRKIYIKYSAGVACYDTESELMDALFFYNDFDEDDYFDCISFTKSIVCLGNLVRSSVAGVNRMASTDETITSELETTAPVGILKATIQEKDDVLV